MLVEPYLNLNGRAGEAMAFYGRVFGGQVLFATRMGDLPQEPEHPLTPEEKNRVIYGGMSIRGTTVHFSDMQREGLSAQSMISLMVKFDDEADLSGVYRGLLEGGQALMELAEADFAKQFAWVKDRFGIDWQLMLE